MIRVLKDDGMIVMGDLMFEKSVEKEKLLSKFTNEEIQEIEDEYYSNIEDLQTEFKKYGKRLVKYKIDKLNFVVSIK